MGKRVVTAKISRENGKETKKEILKSQMITKPVKKNCGERYKNCRRLRRQAIYYAGIRVYADLGVRLEMGKKPRRT